jgi:tRNA(adenine34) deaminase
LSGSDAILNIFSKLDEQYMQTALIQAEKAAFNQEVPVGAVLVHNDKIIAEAFNQPISHCDPSAHAEIIALRKGAEFLKNYRLIDTTLYVTLEPCIMCVGAIMHARVKRVVFGAYDKRAGAVQSVYPLGMNENLHHCTAYQGGLFEAEAVELLQKFFKARR